VLLRSGDSLGRKQHQVCAGSSHYLKSLYGVGYTLTLVCPTSDPTSAAVGPVRAAAPPGKLAPRSVRATKLVSELLPEAMLLSAMGAEVSYQVPFAAAHRFPRLFEDLDALGAEEVQGYGVSVTTLDEVFVKVGLESGEVRLLARRCARRRQRKRRTKRDCG
jgi:hypothetical protein